MEGKGHRRRWGVGSWTGVKNFRERWEWWVGRAFGKSLTCVKANCVWGPVCSSVWWSVGVTGSDMDEAEKMDGAWLHGAVCPAQELDEIEVGEAGCRWWGVIEGLYFKYLTELCGMRDLSSLTRHWTHAPCTGRVLTTGLPGKSQRAGLSKGSSSATVCGGHTGERERLQAGAPLETVHQPRWEMTNNLRIFLVR